MCEQLTPKSALIQQTLSLALLADECGYPTFGTALSAVARAACLPLSATAAKALTNTGIQMIDALAMMCPYQPKRRVR